MAIIFGAFGGRFDQEMASIDALFKWNSVFDRVLLMDAKNLATLLDSSSKRHMLKPITEIEGPMCGLIPIAGPVESVHSSGLKYNLEGRGLAWGVLTSTSNEIIVATDIKKEFEEVVVETSHPLMWTCSLKSIS